MFPPCQPCCSPSSVLWPGSLIKICRRPRGANNTLSSPPQLKYKEKHVKERGSCHAVPDTPQILLAKAVSHLVSEVPLPLPCALLSSRAHARPVALTLAVGSLRTSIRTTWRSTWPRARTRRCQRPRTLFASRKWPSMSAMWVTAPGHWAAAGPLDLRIQPDLKAAVLLTNALLYVFLFLSSTPVYGHNFWTLVKRATYYLSN